MAEEDETSLAARVAELEERVIRLEGAAAEREQRPSTPDPDAFWVLEGLKVRVPQGAVVYSGTAPLPTGERFDWQMGATLDDLMDLDWAELTDRLGALGHPVRLHLLQRILAGARTVAELGDDESLGTTGQLYHHLRQLVAAGWLESAGRGRYAVPGSRVVPLLAVLTAVWR
ncbi:MAG: helix-turn-helix domain-containing protein [Streptosporangiales bacterium]|nr:helix-turn-helix domain-containing protein [Streptosporangiales bacterium]